MLAWLSVWSEVQMICISSSWCHCHLVISCFIKIRLVWPSWCRLTQVVLEKRPLKRCLLLFEACWRCDVCEQFLVSVNCCTVQNCSWQRTPHLTTAIVISVLLQIVMAAHTADWSSSSRPLPVMSPSSNMWIIVISCQTMWQDAKDLMLCLSCTQLVGLPFHCTLHSTRSPVVFTDKYVL